MQQSHAPTGANDTGPETRDLAGSSAGLARLTRHFDFAERAMQGSITTARQVKSHWAGVAGLMPQANDTGEALPVRAHTTRSAAQ
jgi:hypothetical protein